MLLNFEIGSALKVKESRHPGVETGVAAGTLGPDQNCVTLNQWLSSGQTNMLSVVVRSPLPAAHPRSESGLLNKRTPSAKPSDGNWVGIDAPM
jgi:hypothetical protein